MLKKLTGAALGAFLFVAALIAPAIAQTAGFNGTGSISRPNNTNTYGSGAVSKLMANNTTGSAVPMSIVVQNTVQGPNYIIGARFRSTAGSAISGASFKIFLYSKPPTTTSLVDGSTYVAPYAADLPNYIGSLTCSSMAPTNDGTAQYYSECSISSQIASALRFTGSAVSTTLYGLPTVTTGYVPAANEVESVDVATGY
jgi:hypothetical protein